MGEGAKRTRTPLLEVGTAWGAASTAVAPTVTVRTGWASASVCCTCDARCVGVRLRRWLRTLTGKRLAMQALSGDGAVVIALPAHCLGSALITTLDCMRVDISMPVDEFGTMLSRSTIATGRAISTAPTYNTLR